MFGRRTLLLVCVLQLALLAGGCSPDGGDGPGAAAGTRGLLLSLPEAGLPWGPGCGPVTTGCCIGNTLLFCQFGALKVQDCAMKPSCGWDSVGGHYSCGTSGSSDPSGSEPKSCYALIPDGGPDDDKGLRVDKGPPPDAPGPAPDYFQGGDLGPVACGDKKCSWPVEDCASCPWDCGRCDGCMPTTSNGCAGCACESCVEKIDPGCGTGLWDGACADICRTQCGGCRVSDAGLLRDLGAPPDGPSGPKDAGPSTEAGTVCGDGLCEAPSEDCSSCIKDCGKCTGCEVRQTPGCPGCACESCVCAADADCCSLGWDALCVARCRGSCGGSCPGLDAAIKLDQAVTPKPDGPISPDSRRPDSRPPDARLPDAPATVCGNGKCESPAEDCSTCNLDCGICTGCETKATPGCWGCACESCVCGVYKSCCSTAWTAQCATACATECGGKCGGTDSGVSPDGSLQVPDSRPPPDLTRPDAPPDGPAVRCGDNTCSSSEDCSTCPTDCGICTGCESKQTGGCWGCACESCVCGHDSTCCSKAWTASCASLCASSCGGKCGGDAGPSPDLGKPTADQGKPPADQGKPPADLSKPKLDLGKPPADLSKPKLDLGKPPADLSKPKLDLGKPPADLGKPKLDLGKPTPDAGLPGDRGVPDRGPICGDGQCETTEDCSTCSKDCGTCTGCENKRTGGCGGCACEACVCTLNASCCTMAWTSTCAAICHAQCGARCAGFDAGSRPPDQSVAWPDLAQRPDLAAPDRQPAADRTRPPDVRRPDRGRPDLTLADAYAVVDGPAADVGGPEGGSADLPQRPDSVTADAKVRADQREPDRGHREVGPDLYSAPRGEQAPESGCSCQAGPAGSEVGLPLLLALLVLRRRRRGRAS